MPQAPIRAKPNDDWERTLAYRTFWLNALIAGTAILGSVVLFWQLRLMGESNGLTRESIGFAKESAAPTAEDVRRSLLAAERSANAAEKAAVAVETATTLTQESNKLTRESVNISGKTLSATRAVERARVVPVAVSRFRPGDEYLSVTIKNNGRLAARSLRIAYNLFANRKSPPLVWGHGHPLTADDSHLASTETRSFQFDAAGIEYNWPSNTAAGERRGFAELKDLEKAILDDRQHKLFLLLMVSYRDELERYDDSWCYRRDEGHYGWRACDPGVIRGTEE